MSAECNGICLYASDVGVPVPGNPVVTAHPECELHGEPDTSPVEEPPYPDPLDEDTREPDLILSERITLAQDEYYQSSWETP